MQQGELGWTRDPNQTDLWQKHGELIHKHNKLVRDWNKFVGEWNARVAPAQLRGAPYIPALGRCRRSSVDAKLARACAALPAP